MKTNDQRLLEEAYTQINEIMMSSGEGSGQPNQKYYNPDGSFNVNKIVSAVEHIHKLFRNLYEVEALKTIMQKDRNIERSFMKVEMKIIDLGEDLKGISPTPDDEDIASNFE